MVSGGSKPESGAVGQSRSIVVYGAGAVGCYFGAKLAEAGLPVTLLARARHADAINRDGLLFESGSTRRRIAVAASTDPALLADADLVLVCVKTRDTVQAARALKPVLAADAVVVSMQNGVDNVARMRTEGIDALGAVVYVGASMPGPGHLLHAGRGDLVIGEYGPVATPDAIASGTRAARVAALFESAGVRCRIEPDIRAALWKKLVMNCAFNAMSAIGRARYGTLVEREDTRALLVELVHECVAVANAEGITLGAAGDLVTEALELGRAMSPAISSTAQDLIAGRPTEIDSLNGHVAARGRALGIPAPANAALAAMVRLIESAGAAVS
jgi:2-dehydropantoate 2-reductase